MATLPTLNKKSSAADFLVTVGKVSGTWATCSGGNPMSTVTKSWDGGARRPDILTGPVDFDDLTVGRDYLVSRDAAVAAALRQRVGEFVTTIKKQPLNKQKVRTGPPTTYVGVLTKVTDPSTDAASADKTQLTLTFSIQGVL